MTEKKTPTQSEKPAQPATQNKSGIQPRSEYKRPERIRIFDSAEGLKNPSRPKRR